jgi:hypothetical protein
MEESMIPKLGRPLTTESGWTAEHVEECSTLVDRNPTGVEKSSMLKIRDDLDECEEQKAGSSPQHMLDTFEEQ